VTVLIKLLRKGRNVKTKKIKESGGNGKWGERKTGYVNMEGYTTGYK